MPPPCHCSVFIATSLDGFIARTDGSIDWLSAVNQPGEDYGYGAFWSSIDTLVIGRGTYETSLGFESWPYEAKRVVVLTHHPRAPRHGETFFTGDLRELVEGLARDGAKRVYIDGGNVIQQFLALHLIDDLTLSVIPVLLGSGRRLFSDSGHEQLLELAGAHSYPSGLAQLRYRVPRHNRSDKP